MNRGSVKPDGRLVGVKSAVFGPNPYQAPLPALPESVVPTITITDTGRRTTIALPQPAPGDGDGWAVRDAAEVLLRRAGAHWSREGWWIGRRARARDTLVAEVEALYAAGADRARELLLSQAVVGRGERGGRFIYLLRRPATHTEQPGCSGSEHQRGDRRRRVCRRDGGGARLVDAAEVTVARWYGRPQTIAAVQRYAAQRQADARYSAAAERGALVVLREATEGGAPWAVGDGLPHPSCPSLPLVVLHVATRTIDDGRSLGLPTDYGVLCTAYCSVAAPSLTREQRRRLAALAAQSPEQAAELRAAILADLCP